jgi:glycosyltransferase involved in cell wall biosynthesis
MRIVALGFRGFPNVQGGIENHCEHLYPRLVNFGCEVIAFSRASYTGKTPYEYKGVKIIPVWAPRHKTIETLLHTGLCTLMAKKYKPDIIHYHAIGPAIFVPLAKKLGFKVITTHHGFDYDRKKWGPLAKAFLKNGERCLSKSDLVITVSEHIKKQLQRQYNCRVETIPNGVDLPEIIPAGHYCQKWRVVPEKYFLFAGRLVPEKCVHDLLNAFSTIKTDWKLVIAGAADYENLYSRELMNQAASNSKVIMTGFITGIELQELFSNAGCFVLPSSHEGLSIVLLEALSFGLPCIISDIPANKGINHPTVQYFPVHRVAALSDLLIKTAEKMQLTDRNQGRFYVTTHFNWDSIASRTHELLLQICKTKQNGINKG